MHWDLRARGHIDCELGGQCRRKLCSLACSSLRSLRHLMLLFSPQHLCLHVFLACCPFRQLRGRKVRGRQGTLQRCRQRQRQRQRQLQWKGGVCVAARSQHVLLLLGKQRRDGVRGGRRAQVPSPSAENYVARAIGRKVNDCHGRIRDVKEANWRGRRVSASSDDSCR